MNHFTSNDNNYSIKNKMTFDEPDSPANIQYNEDKSIISATFEKVIEKVTTIQNTGFFYDILLTHTTFCTSIDFIRALTSRYEQCSEQNKVVKIKVINILKTWVDKFWVDFSKDEQLISIFLDFVSSLEASKHDSIFSDSLRKAYMKKRGEPEEKMDAMSPITPRSQTKESTEINDILKIPSDQLATQMTILESELYKSLKGREFVEFVWSKDNKNMPNIQAMQERFLVVSNWVSTEICKTEDFKRRVQIVQYFIEVAQKLKSLNNFNSLMQILVGLNNPSVARLKNTFSSLPSNVLSSFNELQDFTQKTKNFEKLLKSLHTCDPPCIPFMKIYENNLTLIRDEQDNINNQINIVKRRKVGSVVKEISQYQVVSYNLESNSAVQNYLKNLFFYEEEVNMRLSCYIEPKLGESRGDKPVELMNTEELMKSEEDEEFELEYVEGYRFYEKDCKNNLIIEVSQGVETIKAGSLEKLVERLTYEKLLFDTSFISTFFTTFRCFSTPHEILDLLIMRYNCPMPKDRSPETLLKFQKKKLTPIRLRVFNALKIWVDKYFHDFKVDPTLLEKLTNFINTSMESTNPKFSQQLKLSISKQLNPTIKVNMPNSRHSSVFPSKENLSKLSILDFDCEEVSRQLALILHEHYSRIRASEFSKKAWMHINSHETAPNITSFNRVMEKISNNIKIQLERCSDDKLSDSLSSWIEVVDYSRKINNWQIVVKIVKVLEQFHVSELDEVWNAIPKENISVFKEAKRYINNPGELKRFCQFAFPPVIPVLNIYLDDIANMEEKFPDMASTTKKLINFEKYKFLAETIGPLETYQRVSYSYYPVEYIRQWLLYDYTPEDMVSIQKNRYSVLLDSIKSGTYKKESLPPPEKQRVFTNEEIMSIIQTDEFKTKFQFLINEVIEDYILELKRDLLKKLDGNENPSTLRLKEYAKKIYSHCTYSKWRCDNSQGILYSISIDVFKDQNTVYLCNYREECDHAFLLYTIQIRRLYKKLYPNTSCSCTIFTYKASDHIKEICNKVSIEIKVVE